LGISPVFSSKEKRARARSLSIEVTGLTLKVCHVGRRDDPIARWSQAIVA
jgi:hypothetical protein